MDNNSKQTNNLEVFHKYRIEYELNMQKLRTLDSFSSSESNSDDYELEKMCLKAELASLKDCIAAIVTSQFHN